MIGFIGFGEAGFHLAKGLREAGLDRLHAYDLHSHTPGRCEKIEQRARESGTPLVGSSSALAQCCDVLVSTVTASSAMEAAGQTAPHLKSWHIYADLNSVSPATKQGIGRIVTDAQARFVEGAIMAPVPPHGHRVPILLGGPAAPEFVERLGPFGMDLEVLTAEVGTAAAIKMFRSIMIKGIEALTLECALGASEYGAAERVFHSLSDSFPGLDWNRLASYMVGRVVVHGDRRAREMEEVAATLRALDIEPIMAEATARRQDWCASLNLAGKFGKDGPASYREVVDEIRKIRQLKSTASR